MAAAQIVFFVCICCAVAAQAFCRLPGAPAADENDSARELFNRLNTTGKVIHIIAIPIALTAWVLGATGILDDMIAGMLGQQLK
jgi:hypothetical protein